jgi:hypothetical protein
MAKGICLLVTAGDIHVRTAVRQDIEDAIKAESLPKACFVISNETHEMVLQSTYLLARRLVVVLCKDMADDAESIESLSVALKGLAPRCRIVLFADASFASIQSPYIDAAVIGLSRNKLIKAISGQIGTLSTERD